MVANGAPTIVLRLQQNAGYAQQGTPEDKSPYAGVAARKFGVAAPPAKTKTKAKPKIAAPKAKPTKTIAAAKKTKVAAKKSASTRTPAFVVAGAPAEPLDEMTLAARATKLNAWSPRTRSGRRAAVDHWLYQHNWIVSGAKFGWSHGAESLRTLVAVDERVQKLWGVGKDSEAVARKALVDREGVVTVMLVERWRLLLADESGFTLVELITSMAILLTIMTAFTGLLVSTSRAELDMNNRFQAQTEAKLGLSKLRREVHCASAVAVGPATPGTRATLTLNAACPTAGAGTTITWCTVANGTGRYGLWRYVGGACSGTGVKVADYLSHRDPVYPLRPVDGQSRQAGCEL